MSQIFTLQGSHIGWTLVMTWGGSPAAGQPLTWPPLPPPAGYWPPPPPAGHPSQSSSTPPPPSGQRMPPWTTPIVSHLCVLSIVPFVIRANIERLAYLSIYVFKHPSSSVGRDYINGVLNMEWSGEGGGTSNDAAPWSSCMSCCVLVWRLCKFLCEDNVLLCEDYRFSLIYALLCQNYMYCCINLLYGLFWRVPMRGGIQNKDYIKKLVDSLINRVTYGPIFLS
jgi:hypothetical protein